MTDELMETWNNITKNKYMRGCIGCVSSILGKMRENSSKIVWQML